MYFEHLQNNLVEELRARVRNGEITERRLARLAGVSQPHLHNVLKGVRTLSIALSDRILRELEITVPELLEEKTALASAPLLQDRLGPQVPYPRDICRGRHPIPPSLNRCLARPVMLQLAADPQMEPDLRPNDMVLVDQDEALRSMPDPSSIYLLQLFDRGLARYVRRGPGVLQLATAKTRECPELWQSIQLDGHDILKLIRGRIVWIGREMETPSEESVS